MRTIVLVARLDDDRFRNNEDFLARFSMTVERLLSAGKRVVVVDPFPIPPSSVPTSAAIYAWTGREPTLFGRSLPDHLRRNRRVLALLDKLAAQGVPRIRVHEPLCQTGLCLTSLHGRLLYFDDHHLSMTGIRYIAPQFAPVFDQESR